MSDSNARIRKALLAYLVEHRNITAPGDGCKSERVMCALCTEAEAALADDDLDDDPRFNFYERGRTSGYAEIVCEVVVDLEDGARLERALHAGELVRLPHSTHAFVVRNIHRNVALGKVDVTLVGVHEEDWAIQIRSDGRVYERQPGDGEA